MMPSADKKLAQMASEWLREVSALLAVFPILDVLVIGKLTLAWAATSLATSLILFALGAVLEERGGKSP